MPDIDPTRLAEEGKQAFAKNQFELAADRFRQAADAYSLRREQLLAAEMKNNLSVALLQGDRPQAALEAALGTDQIFAEANDFRRQAMAIGNQAAALEALKRYEEAIATYERSAALFAQVNEGDLQAMVMKSAAALKLKTGKITDSAFKMMGALDAKQKPTFFERLLRFFIRMKP